MAGRVTRVDAEVVEQGTSLGRVTQTDAEVVEKPDPKATVTQAETEVALSPSPLARVTQADTEAVLSPTPLGLVTQVVAEVVIPNPFPVEVLFDAIIRRLDQPGSFTLDAVIAEVPGGDCDFDSAFQEDAFQTDAFQICVVTFGFFANAVIKRTQSASFTVDAQLSHLGFDTFTLDAQLARTQSASFTLDAFFVENAPLRLDAVIRAAQTRSFTLDAWIYSPRADPTGPGEPGETPLVSIIVDGVDITRYVVLRDATFTMLVNGAVGSCMVRVRDDAHQFTFVSGSEITVDIDGRRKFGGYILQPRRMLAFPVEDTTDPDRPSRFHVLDGVDYNILFQKRVLYDHTTPADVGLRSWPAGTRDDVMIRYVFDHYTDLGADGVTYNGVQHIGFPNPDKPGVVGSGGLRFIDAMREINRLISGVFYIDPFKDLNYVDVDDPDAEFGLSDHPGPGQIGYRDFEFVRNGSNLRNDAMIWGAGIGSKRMVFSRVTDATSIAAHGLWQYGEFTTALYKQASVDLRTDTVVNGTPQSKRGGKNDQESWNLTSFEPSFTAGQKVVTESEVHGISDTVPIRKMTLTFPTKTSVKQQLVLSHEIDEPWDFFEFPPFPPFGPFGPFPPIDFPDPPFPPKICDPDDFLIGSSGGDFACVTAPEGPPGVIPLGCVSYDPPVTDGAVVLYDTCTYEVEYVVHRAGANCMAVAVTDVNGAPVANSLDLGCVTNGNAQADGVYTETFVAPGATPGINHLYLVQVNTAAYYGYIPEGMSVSARVRYISGPDPRFENIQCVDGDEGTNDNGSSQEGVLGDGTETVFSVNSAYLPGSTRVFINGFFQRPDGIEYTESDPNSGEITFVNPPGLGLSVVILYEAFGAPF